MVFGCGIDRYALNEAHTTNDSKRRKRNEIKTNAVRCARLPLASWAISRLQHSADGIRQSHFANEKFHFTFNSVNAFPFFLFIVFPSSSSFFCWLLVYRLRYRLCMCDSCRVCRVCRVNTYFYTMETTLSEGLSLEALHPSIVCERENVCLSDWVSVLGAYRAHMLEAVACVRQCLDRVCVCLYVKGGNVPVRVM